MAAWDRQTGEGAKEYSYFTVYRDFGADRTLAKVQKTCGISDSHAEKLSNKNQWVSRCDQWDAHLQAIHDRALLTEAAKAGRERAKAFTALLSSAEAALGEIDLSKANLGQVAAAMKAAADGLRLEEGLATENVTMELHDVRAVLSRLPAEVRGSLLRALGEYADAAGRSPVVGGVPGRSPFEE